MADIADMRKTNLKYVKKREARIDPFADPPEKDPLA